MEDDRVRTAGRETGKESIYRPVLCRLESVTDLTPIEKNFRLVRLDGQPFGQQPGQFIQLSVFGIGEAPISISSSTPLCIFV